MIFLVLFCVCFAVGWSDQDSTVTRLEVEKYAFLSRELKKLFNDKGLEIAGVLHNTLGELYHLNPNNVLSTDLLPIFKRHNRASVLIRRALSDDIHRTLQKVKSKRKRGWWGKVGDAFATAWHKTSDFVVDHASDIADGLEITMQVMEALPGKRAALHPSKVLEKETHHLSAEKLKVDAHVANVTAFLDNELHFLREHLSPNPHAVAVPNKFTGSLTSAN